MPIDMTELIHTADLQSSIKNEIISLLITGGSFTKRIQPRYSDFQGCTLILSRGHGSISITLGHFRSPQRLVKLSEFWVPPHLPLLQGLSVKWKTTPRNRTVPALRHRTSLQGKPCFPDNQTHSAKAISPDFKDYMDTCVCKPFTITVLKPLSFSIRKPCNYCAEFDGAMVKGSKTGKSGDYGLL